MNPYSRDTKRGEQEIEAIDRSIDWLCRTNAVDTGSMIDTLKKERNTLIEEYRKNTIEVALDNFVYNNESEVQALMSNPTLDEIVDILATLEEEITSEFGYVEPYDLSKENLLWLVSEELKYWVDSHMEYTNEMFEDVDLDAMGEKPNHWGEYPEFNR